MLDQLPVSLNKTSPWPLGFYPAAIQRNANREQRKAVWTWQPFTTSMVQDGKAENPTVQCSNLIFRERNERAMALGKNAFLFPSDTPFRSGIAPRKDFKYERPLFLKTQFWLISGGFYGFLWAWITGFMTSPFVSFTSKRIQKLSQ